MHELSLCAALVREVSRLARERGASPASVRLRIGPLSGIDTTTLAHAWPAASAGSECAGAALMVEPVPIRVRCTTCQAVSEAAPQRLACGACGAADTVLISGDEMLIESVQLRMEAASV